ncbi:hypothetical protein [Nonomuraea sp. NPDC003804]|uniref:hypothetical protein n=1 Tax=Nonomuraea sp. NPDC003804 TaxID=3154547 RepID=UPI0033B530DB
MARRLSSGAVTLGAVVTVSSVVLSGCASGGSTYVGSEQVATDSFTEEDTSAEDDLAEEAEEAEEAGEDEEEEDEVVARCVRRDSESDDGYVIVSDDRCDGAGRHSAFLWYYGGTKVKNRLVKGTTIRPRGAYIVTKGGDEITRTGKISRSGFGNRTSTGS